MKKLIGRYKQVYDALLTHEYMSNEAIAKATGLGRPSVSSALTRLRRAGWISYDHASEGRRTHLWKKHKTPLKNPQQDIIIRRKGKKRQASMEDLLVEALNMIELARTLNRTEMNFVSYGYAGDVELFVKESSDES